MTNQRRKKIKIGDIYAIPLPNGKYAFGKIFRDASIGIYKYIGDTINDIPEQDEYQFIVGIYKDVLQSGLWTIVGNRQFRNSDEEWPPPYYIIDKINGGYSRYYKGQIIPSTKEECEGLEKAAVWDAHHIIDRIMGENKWHKMQKQI